MNYKTIVTVILCSSIFASCNKKLTTTSESVSLKDINDSVSYSLGVSIGKTLARDAFDSIRVDVLAYAMEKAMGTDSLLIDEQKSQQVIQSYMIFKRMQKGERSLQEGKKFLDENRTKAGVVQLPSGLQYMVIKEGTGAKPLATDKVTVHYHGTLIDGTVFDSSVDRKQPAQFKVNEVIPGWTEVLQLMPVGSKWKVFIPHNLAYGEQGAGGQIGPNSTLIFEVDLIAIDKTEESK
jgi:FKBP-type peptidyl-prolyl cis-trans isomerase FklB